NRPSAEPGCEVRLPDQCRLPGRRLTFHRASAVGFHPQRDALAFGGDLPLFTLQRMVVALPQGAAALAEQAAHLMLRQCTAAVLDPGAAGGVGHAAAMAMATVVPHWWWLPSRLVAG